MTRKNNRSNDEMRPLEIEVGVNKHAEGSALVKFGDTHVICTASIENHVPRWMRGSNEGWITAEYGMLPRSTHERMNREAARGKQSGRTMEIQRLIGRSLRQAVDLKYLKDKTINVDCDVIQADGGTRTASISGACVALFEAIKNSHDDQRAIKEYVAAVSIGLKDGCTLLDLDYEEDSSADTDLNVVMTESGGIIEIQGTAEKYPFTKNQLDEMIKSASNGIADIVNFQKIMSELKDFQKTFIELALQSNALEFGKFTLKSGRSSPYFFNAAKMLNGCDLFKLANCYVDAIEDSSMEFDCLYGPAYKGIFLGSIVAAVLSQKGNPCPLSFNRKEAKDHGEGGNIIGANPVGNVMIIDDVLSAGTAARESIKILEDLHAIPKIFLVGLDRQEKGKSDLSAKTELEKDFGIHVSSIVNLEALIEYSHNNKDFHSHTSELERYRNSWGA